MIIGYGFTGPLKQIVPSPGDREKEKKKEGSKKHPAPTFIQTSRSSRTEGYLAPLPNPTTPCCHEYGCKYPCFYVPAMKWRTGTDSEFILSVCACVFVRVRRITSSRMVRFKFIWHKWSSWKDDACKNHVPSEKVNVTLCTLILGIGYSDTVFSP